MKQQNELKELWPGQSVELLKELHVLTRDGKLNQDSRRKLKQIQHLVQLIKPHLDQVKTIADLGAGKSYLGFMLYDLILRAREDSQLYAIEQRPQLVQRCQEIAKASNFSRIHFISDSILGSLESSKSARTDSSPEKRSDNSSGESLNNSPQSSERLPDTIDAVTALHACDTATDEAIAFSLAKQAKFIALVPCCQAEVARLLEKAPGAFSDSHRATKPIEPIAKSLWRHGIHRREFGSHLTNVIRCLFLESRGYKVRVTELVGWEHSMKNELILAEKIQHGNKQAQLELDRLLAQLPPLPMRLFQEVPGCES